ncbi:MAG: DNA repair ATPase RecN [Chloroflexi bacterium AL-W]|nr:DNA repair ATPase RecN [Chloroflexi bacterium AL-N1]NOK68143.1 DNA repair ATPase RecN [Chloroflexi bacterium AL-N10]NOK73483.1 DNA repair ATPase RecN [Chloroflexi bacterium AL-N5]NOK83397.1 DNA repair ATPase RecN [Chloroflexi bacterium AL-W]NOK87814.1 DNA repair ATPase RecN [Chloroflexi bacterium AL-N15]
MLLELNIRDFAIINQLHLRLGAGFIVLTGETGAGKSIIIDALGTLRGDKTDPTFVSAGAERARIEGVFSLTDRPDVIPLLQDFGLWDDADDTLILSREINAESGRSVARINGRAVNSSILREVGGRLVDIHGQHDGLSLFNARTHVDMLDRYGGLLPLRETVASKVAELQKVRDELTKMREAATRRTERIEELRFLLEDVQAAQLRLGEEEELTQERSLVQNGARIHEIVLETYALLYDGEQSEPHTTQSIIEMMGSVSALLEELARLDTSRNAMLEQSRELLFSLEEIATGIRAYRDSIDFDASRLDEIEDRLTVIRNIQRRHRGTIEQILERAESAEAEIDRLIHSEEHMADLETQEAMIRTDLGTLAGTLSQKRCTAGNQLAKAVEEAVRELSMPHVQFYVNINHADDLNGVPLPNAEDRRLAFDKTGIDQVEFMLSPNPGEPLKPLARIASGGESARLLLALKSILSRVDDVPTLVFDEVDVGVGGRAGQVVGEKLWGISTQHQVICITHLPQVAAFGDTHFTIVKHVLGSSLNDDLRTRTNIHSLIGEQRTEELAAMLDGTPVSDHSRRSAQEMLDRAQVLKQKNAREVQQPLLVR